MHGTRVNSDGYMAIAQVPAWIALPALLPIRRRDAKRFRHRRAVFHCLHIARPTL
jgi:hypothetical protein